MLLPRVAAFCVWVWVIMVTAGGCQPADATSTTTQTPTTTVKSTPPAVVRVDVWHDTVCPWCRIGLHTLDVALTGDPGAAAVEVVHHPFLLNPDAPPGGSDLRAELGAKFGADRLDAMFERVSEAGAAVGVRFDWQKVRRSPNTVASHVLIEATPPSLRRAVIEGIHRAHFEEGRDIGDVDVLVDIAKAAGVAEVEVRAALADPRRHDAIRSAAMEARRRGVRGVPHIEVGTQVLNGAQPLARLRDALAAARGPADRVSP